MRYLGSKTLLLEQIHQLIREYDKGIFCDPFGGIGTVSSYMKKQGYKVVTGDILNFAYYFQLALVGYEKECDFDKLKEYLHINSNEELEMYLSNIVFSDSWVEKEYSVKRKFFTKENARHIQGCIECIKEWDEKGIIEEKERIVLLASLINSFDKVANTAGTYYAYLKDFYRKSIKEFKFSLLHTIPGKECYSYKMDANELVKNTECDVLYLDPPYNQRDYAKYYHFPETVSLEVVPKPVGKSGMFQLNAVKSNYNRKKLAIDAFEELIFNAKAKCIIFHYTDNGLIDIDRAKKILGKRGKIEKEIYFDSKGYNTTGTKQRCQHHIIKVCL